MASLLVETDTYNGRREELSTELMALGVRSHDVLVHIDGCTFTLEGLSHNVRGALDRLRHPGRPVATAPFLEPSSGRYGYRGGDGTVAVPPTLERALPVADGRAVVTVDGENWLITDTGDVVAPLPGMLGQDTLTDGRLLMAGSDLRWGYVGREGAWVIAPTLEDARPFSEGLASATPDGERWGYLSTAGVWVLLPTMDSAFPFVAGEAQAAVVPGQWVRLRHQDGQIVEVGSVNEP